MKSIISFFLFIAFFFHGEYNWAQQTVSYSLENDFSADVSSFPDLTPLANVNGQTGSFQSVEQPTNFCPGGDEMMAYHFDDNAGLEFDNSNDFLGCEYTIELLFKFDELPSLLESPWVFVLGFQLNEDSGLFFEFNPFFGTSFDVWQGTSNPSDPAYPAFDIDDWQKLTVVRECNGMVNFYFGCTFFDSYNDAVTQILLPGDQVIFFQDDPSILASEAQPGFVRNIQFTNFAMSPEEVEICCTNLCDDLISNCVIETNLELETCDINAAGVDSLLYSTPICDSLVIITTTFFPSDTTFLFATSCDSSQVGVSEQGFLNSHGCDSLVVTTTTFIEAPLIQYNFITCNPEEVILDTLIYNCDSIVIITTMLIDLDTVFLPTLSVSAGSTVIILGNTVTQPGLYCQTNINSDGCDSTICQQVDWLVATSEINTPGGLYIPNAFSPNEDGVNDYFALYTGSEISNIQLFRVFNGQGQLLFERQHFAPNIDEFGWNGNFRGNKMPVGTYIYYLEIEGVGKNIRSTMGTFSLIR